MGEENLPTKKVLSEAMEVETFAGISQNYLRASKLV